MHKFYITDDCFWIKLFLGFFEIMNAEIWKNNFQKPKLTKCDSTELNVVGGFSPHYFIA